ncbi:hypothetical protein C2U35_08340 [Ralstonia solanacearum]|nr:hypothetical protein C2U35_08340 [Ralstonia solanacearum]
MLDHRLRPDRPLRRARRLRLHRAGHGRLHEPDRRARRPARRRPAEGRRGHLGPDDGHVRHRRRAGRAGAPRPHRRGPVHRHGAARRAGRHAGQHEHQLPGQRPGPQALGQRAPEHRAVPDLPDRGRLDHRGGRQRRAVPPLCRGRRQPRTGRRPALCHQPAARGQPSTWLVPILAGMVRRLGKAEWIRRLEAAGVPCGPINSLDEVFDRRAGQGARPARRLPHPSAGTVPLVGSPVRMSATPPQAVAHPPLLGEHTEAVLRDVLDLPQAQIAALRAQGVI